MYIQKETESKSFLVFSEMTTNSRIDVEKEAFGRAVAELKNWDYNRGASNFSAKLFELMSKADMSNKQKLLKGFPCRTSAYLLWMQAPDKEAFYREHLK